MVDMMTMLVIFLLQQFSSTGEVLYMQADIKLPEASHGQPIELAPVVAVSAEQVVVTGTADAVSQKKTTFAVAQVELWLREGWAGRRVAAEELFDIQNDLHEQRNLAANPAYAGVLLVRSTSAITAAPELVWQGSKRVVMIGTGVYTSHSEENYDTNEMGAVAIIDATSKGEIPLAQTKWRTIGLQPGFSSPVTDGKVIYQIDNGAILIAFDAATGAKLWQQKLGTIQRASPVFADGKLYVGTENGKFFILRPRQGGADVLSEVELGTTEDPEEVYASAAVSRGRIFFVSNDRTGHMTLTDSTFVRNPATNFGSSSISELNSAYCVAE